MNKLWGILLWLLALPALAQSPGPQGSEGGKMREQDWRIPGPGGVLMDATVFRPPGNAKAPLMVMNHGSPASSADRPGMKRPHYTAVSSFFVSRGYVVVLPLRRGYGATGSYWAEEYGRCNNPDYFDAGLQTPPTSAPPSTTCAASPSSRPTARSWSANRPAAGAR